MERAADPHPERDRAGGGEHRAAAHFAGKPQPDEAGEEVTIRWAGFPVQSDSA